MDITIPNHQLVLPNYGYDALGSLTEFNSTTNEVLINSLQEINKNDMPQFGRSFLTSAVLIVDQDQEQFTVAPVNATSNEKIVPLGPPVCQSPNGDAAPTSTTSGNAAGATSPSAISPTSSVPPTTQRAVSTGVVAGATVGGAAALAFCLLAFLLIRRRRRTQQHHLARIGSEREDPPITRVSQPGLGMYKPEMASDHTHQPPSEMPSQQHPPYQFAPYEMESQRPTPPPKQTEFHEMSSH